MTESADRRDFLKVIVGGAAATASLGLLAPALARAATATPPLLDAVKLSDTLSLFTGFGGNVVAAHDGEDLALVDGGLPERSAELLKVVEKEMGSRRVRTLFNTHWHPEQTGSNERLGKDGAKIIAHENTKLWLGYANAVPGQDRTYGPLSPKARPTDTFYYGSANTTVGAEPVEYGYLLQAHTDGDIYVYFRKSNVLVTGGAVSGAGWPIIDYKTGGWIVGMVDGLKTLMGIANDDTRIVPANGPALTRADLVSQHTMYATISERLQKMLRQGLGPDEAIAKAPTAEFDATWGDPKQFVGMAFRSLWGHFAPDA
jgi:glyoxylase-like metal-dependent hydrolase (beta-lactamase superfamily II)